MTRLLALAAAAFFVIEPAFAQPCALACASGLNISLGPNGATPITPDMITNVNSTACLPNGNAAFSVTVMAAGGAVLPTSPNVGCANIGQTLTVKLTHLATGNLCWSTIFIEDKLPPVLSCVNKTISCATQNTLPTNPLIGQPTVSDNCDQSVSLTFLDQFFDLGCGQTYQGQSNLSAYIKRIWTATDDHANKSTCLQHIFLQRKGVADLVFPPNLDGVAAPALPCDPPPATAPSATGWPKIDGQNITTTQGFCELLVNFSDQTFQMCGSTKKILRTWTAVDDCTSEIKTALQIIKIVDQTPPALACPTDFTVDAASASCSANVFFPPAEATDACSGATVTATTPFGFLNSNGGLQPAIPVGEHVVIYNATDGCGNSATCSATVTVRDAAPPTVICDAFTVAPLTTTGTTTFPAKVLDQGSYDNCSPVSLLIFEGKITASSGPFLPNLTFDCSHVGVQNVTMRVRDLVGNENECAVQVQVQDKIAPTITCPPSATVECANFQPGGDLSGQFGSASAADNCPTVTLVEQPTIYNLSDCGVGTVTRKFLATDAGGRTATCQQTITVINSMPFAGNSITWPSDFSTSSCVAAPSNLHPDSLAALFSKPKWTAAVGCASVAASWEDQIFQFAAGACWQIVRKWTVVDWCQFDPNQANSAGKWTKTQVLKISDAVAPIFLNPQKDTLISLGAGCLADFSLPSPKGKDCSSDLAFSVESPIGSGPNFAGVPAGIFNVKWKVADGCGNETSHIFRVTVKDLKKPSPICTGILSVNLMQNGSVAVWAKDFNASSFDNCTPSGLLNFSFSTDTSDRSKTFSCAQKGSNLVKIWATDAAGNQDFCEAILIVQDNAGVCPPTVASLVGGAKNEAGETVENVVFELKNRSNPSISSIFQPSADGSFFFLGQPINAEYEIKPSKNTAPTNGVSAFDLVKISKHILGAEPLGSPYRVIAADVNRSNSVSTADIVVLRKVILGILPDFPNLESWRFVPADHVFPNPAQPFSAPFPSSKIVQSLAALGDSSDFVAIKVGDVNSNADPSGLFGEAEDRNLELIRLLFSDQKFEKGERVEAKIRLEDFEKMEALQFALAFDTAFLKLEKAEGRAFSDQNLNLEKAEKGALRAAWIKGDPAAPPSPEGYGGRAQLIENQLVTLIFSTKKAGQLSQNIFRIEAEKLAPLGWKNEKASPLEIVFENAERPVFVESEKAEIELFQNRPNPFSDATEIEIFLPTADEKAVLEIFDATGRAVFSKKLDGKKGLEKVSVERSALPFSASVFAYRLTTASGSVTKKMIATH